MLLAKARSELSSTQCVASVANNTSSKKKTKVREEKCDTVSPDHSILSTATINGFDIVGVIDTGAAVTVISQKTVEHCNLLVQPIKNAKVTLANNSILCMNGVCTFKLKFLGLTKWVHALVLPETSDSIILGLDTLKKFKVVIDSETCRLHSKLNKKTLRSSQTVARVQNNVKCIELNGKAFNARNFKVGSLSVNSNIPFDNDASLKCSDPDFKVTFKLKENVVLPPRTQVAVPVVNNYDGVVNLTLEIYGDANLFYDKMCRIPSSLTSLKTPFFLLTNFSSNPVHLNCGRVLAIGVVPREIQTFKYITNEDEVEIVDYSSMKFCEEENLYFDVESNWMQACLNYGLKFPETRYNEYPPVFRAANKKALEMAKTIIEGKERNEDVQVTSVKQLTINQEIGLYQKMLLENFLCKRVHLFNKKDRVINPNIEPFEIKTKTESPINVPPYRKSPTERTIIDAYCQDLLQAGLIQPSNSPWASPVILVKKKGNGWRMCVDFRALNKVTIGDTFPLPRIDDTLDSLAGAKFFSTLDCKDGFHQVPITSKDREKTAFITHSGLYEYLVMPFGLKNAPAKFQRVINNVLKHLTWRECLVYLDDIIVFGKTFEEMLTRLDRVFNCLEASGFRLNYKKCAFGQTELDFLGHNINSKGIQPSTSKIEIVKNFPRPTNTKELRSFIGLVSYHRQFLKGMSRHVSVLTKLLKKKVTFNWDQQCEEAFVFLKNSLCARPILTFFDPTKRHVLATDASKEAIGAILKQEELHDGRIVLKPVAYWGRGLNKAEKNYQATELECLALVSAVQKFRHYLQFSKFTVETDHRPLLSVKNFKNKNRRLERWSLSLADFDFDVVYKKGKLHIDVDAISRIPRLSETESSEPNEQHLRALLKNTGKLADLKKLEKKNESKVYWYDRVKPDEEKDEPAEDTSSDDSYKFSFHPEIYSTPSDSTSYDSARSTVSHPPKSSTDKSSSFSSTSIINPSDLTDDSTVLYSLNDPLSTSIKVPATTSQQAFTSSVSDNSQDPSVFVYDPSNPITESDQLLDPVLSRKVMLLKRRVLTKEEVKEVSNFRLEKGLLYRSNVDKVNPKYLLAVPSNLTKGIVSSCHDSIGTPHHGQAKTLSKIQDRFWWPGLKREVISYIQNCQVCQKIKPRYGKKQGLLQPMALEIKEGYKPFSMMAIDVIVLKEIPSRGYKYIIVACDYVTRYVIAAALKNQTASTVTDFIMKNIVLIYGSPRQIITDNATNFTSSVVKCALDSLAIQHKFITAYHPEANGLVERTNGSIKLLLKSLVTENEKEWSSWLPYVVFAYNSTVHSITGYTPYFLVFGFEPRINIENEVGKAELYGSAKFEESPELSAKALDEARELARQKLIDYGNKMKERVDAHRVVADYEVGDKVWLFSAVRPTGRFKAFYAPWLGPFVITKNLGLCSYEIQEIANPRNIQKVHSQRIKRYISESEVCSPFLVSSIPSQEM